MRQYRRTLRGFLDQKYTVMSKRVRGKIANRGTTCVGLPIVSRKEFIDWAYQQAYLIPMFEKYKQSGWKRNLCPTIDRIDNSKGYLIDNMQFLTMIDNLKKDSWRKRRKSRFLFKTNKSGYRYVSWNKRDKRWLVANGKYVGQYKTLSEAASRARQVEMEMGHKATTNV